MSPNDSTKVRIRMYRQGLGDCLLLTFFTGPEPIHMLIDCGTLGATTTNVRMRDVVAQVAEDTGRHIHLLVVTHEHKDHVSGFSSEREAFDGFRVDRVWVAWTEDPNDDLAKQVARFKKDLLASLQLAGEVLHTNQASLEDERQALRGIASGVRELLGFYGDVPAGDTPLGADLAKTVHEAMSYASMRAGSLPDFLSPGRVIEPKWLPGVRFYVLGPPRRKEDLVVLGDHDSPELYGLTQRLSADLARNIPFYTSDQPIASYLDKLGESDADARQAFKAGLPFDTCFRIESSDEAARARYFQSYDAPGEAWRRIDYDWLTAADDLALQLDNATNNTSLVLAIELIGDGRVLLLPADAQLGNWKSWEKVEFSVAESGTTRTVKAADLLKRTVFYKVGHHASHNATMKDKGLEAMQRDDLVAMIPVDHRVALNKTPPWQMPAQALYKRLLQKTHGRVLRSDTEWPRNSDRPSGVTDAEWAEWQAARTDENISIEQLYIEYRLH